MITAIGPILGNGTFVGWRSADGRQSGVSCDDGRVSKDGKPISDYLPARMQGLKRPDSPVAALTGPWTAGAALAFVGRPGTRLFGEPKGGLTTAIKAYPLFDDARPSTWPTPR